MDTGILRLTATSILAWIACIPIVGGQAEGRAPKISRASARALVYEAIKQNNPGAVVSEIGDEIAPDFYNFDVISHAVKASPMVGYFCVNPWTADVWDFHACKRLESASLRRLQERVRKQAGIPKNVQEKLRDQRPLCIGPNER